MRLLIIDTDVGQNIEEKFRTYAKEDVIIFSYNSIVINTDVKFINRFKNFLQKNKYIFESIGWAFHGHKKNKTTFSLFDNDDYYVTLTLEKDGQSTIDKKENLNYFINILKYLENFLIEKGRIDIFLCSILEKPFDALFYYLENTSGINLAGSIDATGHSTQIVSNWILESEKNEIIDIQKIYFKKEPQNILFISFFDFFAKLFSSGGLAKLIDSLARGATARAPEIIQPTQKIHVGDPIPAGASEEVRARYFPDGCEPGKFVLKKDVYRSECVICYPGKYTTEIMYRFDKDTSCETCPIGQFTNNIISIEDTPILDYNKALREGNIILPQSCDYCEQGTYITNKTYKLVYHKIMDSTNSTSQNNTIPKEATLDQLLPSLTSTGKVYIENQIIIPSLVCLPCSKGKYNYNTNPIKNRMKEGIHGALTGQTLVNYVVQGNCKIFNSNISLDYISKLTCENNGYCTKTIDKITIVESQDTSLIMNYFNKKIIKVKQQNHSGRITSFNVLSYKYINNEGYIWVERKNKNIMLNKDIDIILTDSTNINYVITYSLIKHILNHQNKTSDNNKGLIDKEQCSCIDINDNSFKSCGSNPDCTNSIFLNNCCECDEGGHNYLINNEWFYYSNEDDYSTYQVVTSKINPTQIYNGRTKGVNDPYLGGFKIQDKILINSTENTTIKGFIENVNIENTLDFYSIEYIDNLYFKYILSDDKTTLWKNLGNASINTKSANIYAYPGAQTLPICHQAGKDYYINVIPSDKTDDTDYINPAILAMNKDMGVSINNTNIKNTKCNDPTMPEDYDIVQTVDEIEKHLGRSILRYPLDESSFQTLEGDTVLAFRKIDPRIGKLHNINYNEQDEMLMSTSQAISQLYNPNGTSTSILYLQDINMDNNNYNIKNKRLWNNWHSSGFCTTDKIYRLQYSNGVCENEDTSITSESACKRLTKNQWNTTTFTCTPNTNYTTRATCLKEKYSWIWGNVNNNNDIEEKNQFSFNSREECRDYCFQKRMTKSFGYCYPDYGLIINSKEECNNKKRVWVNINSDKCLNQWNDIHTCVLEYNNMYYKINEYNNEDSCINVSGSVRGVCDLDKSSCQSSNGNWTSVDNINVCISSSTQCTSTFTELSWRIYDYSDHSFAKNEFIKMKWKSRIPFGECISGGSIIQNYLDHSNTKKVINNINNSEECTSKGICTWGDYTDFDGSISLENSLGQDNSCFVNQIIINQEDVYSDNKSIKFNRNDLYKNYYDKIKDGDMVFYDSNNGTTLLHSDDGRNRLFCYISKLNDTFKRIRLYEKREDAVLGYANSLRFNNGGGNNNQYLQGFFRNNWIENTDDILPYSSQILELWNNGFIAKTHEQEGSSHEGNSFLIQKNKDAIRGTNNTDPIFNPFKYNYTKIGEISGYNFVPNHRSWTTEQFLHEYILYFRDLETFSLADLPDDGFYLLVDRQRYRAYSRGEDGATATNIFDNYFLGFQGDSTSYESWENAFLLCSTKYNNTIIPKKYVWKMKKIAHDSAEKDGSAAATRQRFTIHNYGYRGKLEGEENGTTLCGDNNSLNGAGGYYFNWEERFISAGIVLPDNAGKGFCHKLNSVMFKQDGRGGEVKPKLEGNKFVMEARGNYKFTFKNGIDQDGADSTTYDDTNSTDFDLYECWNTSDKSYNDQINGLYQCGNWGPRHASYFRYKGWWTDWGAVEFNGLPLQRIIYSYDEGDIKKNLYAWSSSALWDEYDGKGREWEREINTVRSYFALIPLSIPLRPDMFKDENKIDSLSEYINSTKSKIKHNGKDITLFDIIYDNSTPPSYRRALNYNHSGSSLTKNINFLRFKTTAGTNNRPDISIEVNVPPYSNLFVSGISFGDFGTTDRKLDNTVAGEATTRETINNIRETLEVKSNSGSGIMWNYAKIKENQAPSSLKLKLYEESIEDDNGTSVKKKILGTYNNLYPYTLETCEEIKSRYSKSNNPINIYGIRDPVTNTTVYKENYPKGCFYEDGIDGAWHYNYGGYTSVEQQEFLPILNWTKINGNLDTNSMPCTDIEYPTFEKAQEEFLNNDCQGVINEIWPENIQNVIPIDNSDVLNVQQPLYYKIYNQLIFTKESTSIYSHCRPKQKRVWDINDSTCSEEVVNGETTTTEDRPEYNSKFECEKDVMIKGTGDTLNYFKEFYSCAFRYPTKVDCEADNGCIWYDQTMYILNKGENRFKRPPEWDGGSPNDDNPIDITPGQEILFFNTSHDMNLLPIVWYNDMCSNPRYNLGQTVTINDNTQVIANNVLCLDYGYEWGFCSNPIYKTASECTSNKSLKMKTYKWGTDSANMAGSKGDAGNEEYLSTMATLEWNHPETSSKVFKQTSNLSTFYERQARDIESATNICTKEQDECITNTSYNNDSNECNNNSNDYCKWENNNCISANECISSNYSTVPKTSGLPTQVLNTDVLNQSYKGTTKHSSTNNTIFN